MQTSTNIPHNTAAWALAAKTRPLVVSSAPYTSPPSGHVAIKVQSVAVNPIDWILQDQDVFRLRYPAILGSDVAGEIVEVADDVEGLAVGQRVIAHTSGLSTKSSSDGAFQAYALAPRITTCPIPSGLTPARAVVLPLSISTAATGLYQRHHLALPFPEARPSKLHRTVLIWGGASSVGSSAIQLAHASGARVLTTASPRNEAYCLQLGAKAVFDYHSTDVEDALVKALSGHTLAGVFHAAGGEEAVTACARVAARSEGKAIVVTVKPGRYEGLPGSVRVVAIASSDIFGEVGSEVARRIWVQYLPEALAKGSFKAAPEALVVGEGLRSVQHGLDEQKRGVHASKIVVDRIDEDSSKE